MADRVNTPGTAANPNANTTTAAGTSTQAAYDAEAVRVGAGAPMDKRDRTSTHKTTTKDNAATKGLAVGILTFLVLSLWEWLDGAAGAGGDSITFMEMIIYAIVGIVVGVAVKAIDKSRNAKKTRT